MIKEKRINSKNYLRCSSSTESPKDMAAEGLSEPVVMEVIQTVYAKPNKYKVIIYNDDVTDPIFVLAILIEIFNKYQNDAIGIIEKTELEGKALVGIYSKDIAYTYVSAATREAKSIGYPLKFTIEKVKE